jgi:hypothetical protein
MLKYPPLKLATSEIYTCSASCDLACLAFLPRVRRFVSECPQKIDSHLFGRRSLQRDFPHTIPRRPCRQFPSPAGIDTLQGIRKIPLPSEFSSRRF